MRPREVGMRGAGSPLLPSRHTAGDGCAMLRQQRIVQEASVGSPNE